MGQPRPGPGVCRSRHRARTGRDEHPRLEGHPLGAAHRGEQAHRRQTRAGQPDRAHQPPHRPGLDTQRAVAWAIEDPQQLRWRSHVATELRNRRRALVHGLSKPVAPFLNQDASSLANSTADTSLAKSPKDWGWHVESTGAYYAFLRHPFTSIPSDKVAQALAELVGVVTLPGSFFMPVGADATSPDSPGSRLRVSVANVTTESLAKLPERLAILSELWHKKGAGWGVTFK